MPKETWKINQYHGGLNSSADPRDIADNELAEATDVMVDEMGKLRIIGQTQKHDAGASPTVDINAGYGLVQFSHDRVNGHLGEHLANTNVFDFMWSKGTEDQGWDLVDGVTARNEAFYSYHSDQSNLAQTAANRREIGITDHTYAFTYTITGFDNADISVFRIEGGSSQFAAENTDLNQEDGTHTKTFTSHATTVNSPFTIKVTSASGLSGELVSETTDHYNRLFGGTNDWTAVQEGGSVSISTGSGVLSVNCDTNVAKQGAELPVDQIDGDDSDPIVTGKTYIISMDLAADAGTPSMTIGLGGAETPAFTISTVSTTYTKELSAVNITGKLRVFYESTTDLTFTVDNVSVKEKRALSSPSLKIFGSAETGDDYLGLVDDNYTFTDDTCDYNNDPTIAHDADSGAIKTGFGVSGTGIPDGAFVKSITSFTSFELSAATTGGSVTDGTLTFTRPPGMYIYSKNHAKWSESATIVFAKSGIKANFYNVDGALRIGDSSFNNLPVWYGYIYKTLFKNETAIDISEWYYASQELISPSSSYFDMDWQEVTGLTGQTQAIPSPTAEYFADGSDGALQTQVLRTTLEATYTTVGDPGPVTRVDVRFALQPRNLGANVQYLFAQVIIRCGTYNTGTETFGHSKVWETVISEYTIADPYWVDSADTKHTFYFDSVYTQTEADFGGNGSWVTGATESNDVFRVNIALKAGSVWGGIHLHSSVAHEGAVNSLPLLHDGGDLANGYLTGNNSVMMFDWATSSGGDKWAFGDSGKWEIGMTYVYEGEQESPITTFFDETDGTTNYMNLANETGSDAVIETDSRPAILIAIADPNHKGSGNSDGRIFNKRIIGCNIYMKDIFEASDASGVGSWFLQYSADFETGKLKVISTQAEYDAKHNRDLSGQSYYFWNLDAAHSKSPSRVITYQDHTGYKKLDEKRVDGYSTALALNRTAYIANIKQGDRTYGDKMMKSSVNRFDKFSESRVVEVSIADGDSIVKLEEYADRILQFKKQKMHLINVSQDIEFLEETFMYKGIGHPASSCRTDFGIAWANTNGCYLYDGQQVHNLLEKDGRQMIHPDQWLNFLAPGKDTSFNELNGTHTGSDDASVMTDSAATFIADSLIGGIILNISDGSQGTITDNTDQTVTATLAGGTDNDWDDGDIYRVLLDNIYLNPMVGYIPNKRQILVCDDVSINSFADPRMFLYDLVSRSWVTANNDNYRHLDRVKTNFVNDWRGDLVFSHTAGATLKWEDTSSETSNLLIKTKDIDFGEPGVRKKVYKVYLAYKGNGESVDVQYAINGDIDTTYPFYRTTADGSSDKTNSDTTPLLHSDRDDWVLAELKPVTSSDANNIYSFQLVFNGSALYQASGAQQFEINDISIVYRLKGVR